MARLRRWLFRIAILLVVAEGLSLVCLLGLDKAAGIAYVPILPDHLSDRGREALQRYLATSDSYVMHDGEMGWTIRPNARTESGLYRSNGQGLRAEREYSDEPADGTIRVVTFGDSFTHCDDVAFDESWQEQLSAQAPHLEAINGGVPGFGPDQALLRWRAIGGRYHPHIAVLAFMSENISRVVNVFRPFYNTGGGIMLSKPRFVAEAGGLRLLANPISTPSDLERLLDGEPALFAAMAAHDYWYDVMPHAGPADFLGMVRLAKTTRYVLGRAFSADSIIDRRGVYRPDTEALRIVHGILDAFRREALRGGVLPILVLLPAVKDVGRTRSHGVRAYEPLLDLLSRDGYPLVVDLYDAFLAGDDDSRLGAAEGHYTPAANAIVAGQLRALFDRQGLGSAEAVRGIVAREAERVAGR
jgi:hypothetical protein